MNKKKLVVFSGAGLDKESGIKTFRDCEDGLWNNYSLDEVATPKGWKKNKERVLGFYNERRTELENAKPNDAHRMLAELEKYFDVIHVTQNVSDLLERGGSTNVLHLHGELTKAQSSLNESRVVEVGYEPTNLGDKHEDGSQLRPHVVWFGEYPNNVVESANALKEADVLLVIGTTLFIGYTIGLLKVSKDLHNPNMGDVDVFCIDPNPPKGELDGAFNERVVTEEGFKWEGTTTYIEKSATEGMKDFIENHLPKMVEVD